MTAQWYRQYTRYDFKEMKVIGKDFFYLAIEKGIRPENYQSLVAIGYPYGMLGALISAVAANQLEEKQNRKPLPIADALYRMRMDPLTGTGKRVERVK